MEIKIHVKIKYKVSNSNYKLNEPTPRYALGVLELYSPKRAVPWVQVALASWRHAGEQPSPCQHSRAQRPAPQLRCTPSAARESHPTRRTTRRRAVHTFHNIRKKNNKGRAGGIRKERAPRSRGPITVRRRHRIRFLWRRFPHRPFFVVELDRSGIEFDGSNSIFLVPVGRSTRSLSFMDSAARACLCIRRDRVGEGAGCERRD